MVDLVSFHRNGNLYVSLSLFCRYLSLYFSLCLSMSVSLCQFDSVQNVLESYEKILMKFSGG